MYLAAYAQRERPGQHSFRLVDQHTQAQTPAGWRALIDEFRPEVIGLSALTVESPFLCQLTALFKAACPDVPIIAGGPHATAVRAGLLGEAAVDYVIGGEAEVAFVQLLDALGRGEREPSTRISGLCYRRADGSLYEVPNNLSQPAVNDLPLPAYELIDLDRYGSFGRMSPFLQGRYGALFTSRGCPYRCTYCHEVFEKGFRAMAPARVVDEMEHVIDRYGIRQFEFFDDIFNADPKRAFGVCSEIVRRGLKVELCFPNGLRADHLPDELIAALHEAGTIQISFAIETASPRLQKLVRKHMKLDRLRDAVIAAEKRRMLTMGFFMLGFPTETREEAEQTIRFAFSLPLHGAMFFITVPYVGTEMQQTLAAQQGVAGTTDLALSGVFADNPLYVADPNYTSSTASTMSAAELKRLQSWAYARFYFDPTRMRRILRDAPLDVRGLAFRGFQTARFIGGSLPGVGRFERLWQRIERFRSGAPGLVGAAPEAS
jgi:radical SAM superfamily enzyme YgiQ (UPF0313 family)